MIDPNFEPPKPEVARVETAKRAALLPWIKGYFNDVADAIVVSGSLSYGADYSVSPDSDIDIQIVLKDSPSELLEGLDIYEKSELLHAVKGYKKGLYKQFTLIGQKDGIPIESHFWDKKAYIDAVTFKSPETLRLRSSVVTPSTDYGFTFGGTSDAVDYFGEIIEGYPVGVLPSYRQKDSKLYLCRPITNVLGIPIVLKAEPDILAALDECWQEAVSKLKQEQEMSNNPEGMSIVKALPSQYKMSKNAKAEVIAKTKDML